MNIASGWWTSGTLWSALGVVVGAIGVVAAVWVTVHAANPRRRLTYGTLRLRDVDEGGKRVANSVRLYVHNRGRRDIVRGDFHDGKPIVIDIGTEIKDVLESTTLRPGRSVPEFSVENSLVKIGPGLIASDQIIRFSLQVNDPEKHRPSCVDSPLINVDVRRENPAKSVFSLLTLFVLLVLFGLEAVVFSPGDSMVGLPVLWVLAGTAAASAANLFHFAFRT